MDSRSPSMSTMQTRASSGSQRSSHNPYRQYDNKSPTTNPFLDREITEEPRTSDDQDQLSPMFVDYLRAKTGSPVQLDRSTSRKYTDEYRRYTISPVDGKTQGCDRSRTFDAFVAQPQISSDAGQTKKVGHGWQVARALKRVMGSTKGRGARKASHDEAPPVRLDA